VNTAAAVADLGKWVAGVRPDDVDDDVRRRLRLVLVDTLGVTITGARTPELAALHAAWPQPPGPAAVLGTKHRTTVDAAVWLNGAAACWLELDEGNKYARGHPAAHVVPAALAVAADVGATGSDLEAALLAGYEVAARFGRATLLRGRVHPHGNWGAAGAAAAAARLLGLDGAATAAAIDAACGLVLATPFQAALDGALVRNLWVPAAGLNGLAATRLASAGLASVDAAADATLGAILGAFDAAELVADLGSGWDLPRGYFKRHASCSYTHPAADGVLELLAAGVRIDDVVGVKVATHHLAAALSRQTTPTRLAAMFSIPAVVAVAFVHGDCAPTRFEPHALADERVRRLVGATTVAVDEELDGWLPQRRAARVTVRLRDSGTRTVLVPNPVGDADHHPFGRAEVAAKLDGLLGTGAAEAVAAKVDMLLAAEDVSVVPLEEDPCA
jgi:2-methylcitrate dehydratase PrpD